MLARHLVVALSSPLSYMPAKVRPNAYDDESYEKSLTAQSRSCPGIVIAILNSMYQEIVISDTVRESAPSQGETFSPWQSCLRQLKERRAKRAGGACRPPVFLFFPFELGRGALLTEKKRHELPQENEGQLIMYYSSLHKNRHLRLPFRSIRLFIRVYKEDSRRSAQLQSVPSRNRKRSRPAGNFRVCRRVGSPVCGKTQEPDSSR